MAVITVIESVGDGTQSRELQVPSTEGVFIVNGRERQPAHIDSITLNFGVDVSTDSDQCGRTESTQTAKRNWTISIEGIVTSNTTRERNFTLDELKALPFEGAFQLRSDVHSGEVIAREVNIDQTSDLNFVDVGAGDERAYEFELQLRQTAPNR